MQCIVSSVYLVASDKPHYSALVGVVQAVTSYMEPLSPDTSSMPSLSPVPQLCLGSGLSYGLML